MRTALPAVADTGATKVVADIQKGLHDVYEASSYAPLWLSEDGGAGRAEKLLAELDDLRWDGLSTESYGLSGLQSQARGLDGAELPQLIQFDTACTGAYLRASRDLLLGVVAVRRADSLWFHAADSVWNAPEMLARGEEYPSLDSFRSTIPTYAALRKEHQRLEALKGDSSYLAMKQSMAGESTPPDSVLEALIAKELPAGGRADNDDTLTGTAATIARLQRYYGVKATGKFDSTTRRLLARHPDSSARIVRANLERLRWLPRTFSNRYVLVNVPLMELFYREDGRDEFTMRVVVGRLSRQTPSLSAPMANVVFNPPWGVPPTILKNDVLPGIARRGGAYLARKGLVAYDRRGRPVSAGAVNASNYRSFNFRQPPGAYNALGEVKFNMPNKWDIYLHDTPHREDFPKRNRALSSGCVRVAKPKEFAEFILTKLEGREEFDQFRIDSLISARVTKFEDLKAKIPVHIVYLTAFEDGTGGVRFLEDIYKKDRKLLALVP